MKVTEDQIRELGAKIYAEQMALGPDVMQMFGLDGAFVDQTKATRREQLAIAAQFNMIALKGATRR